MTQSAVLPYWTRARSWAKSHAKTYSIQKAVPSVLAAFLQYYFFNLRPLLQTVAVIGTLIGAYIASLSLEYLWNLVLIAPPALDRERSAEFARLELMQIGAEKKRQIIDQLGTLYRGGEEAFKAGQQEIAERWATEAHAFIRQMFGEGEAQLFLSDAGFTFFSGTGRIRNLVDGRLRRLGSLLERANGLLSES